MSDFNLADVLRDVNAQDLGQAGREQIQYIDIDLIDPDPKNFYELSDLDELAANIELVGLQQPLRVRVHPDDAGRWMIVSGHRRRAAIRQLVDDGKDQLRAVACIVEQPAASEALQELRLIYANSGTRKMKPAEISKQADRVEMLLYELKEQGMEFPGRMRDHVAEACKVSKSKLNRLKVIRDNLSSAIKPFFEEGKLAESTAYALAQQPKSHQIIIWGSDYNKELDGSYLREYNVRDAVRILERLIPLKCADGTECANFERMIKRSMKNTCYNPCRMCCKDCERKMECGTVCATVKPEVKAAKQEKKKEEALAKAAEEQALEDDIRSNIEIWKRLGDAAINAEIAFDRVAELMTDYHWQRHEYRNILADPESEKNHIFAAQFDEWDILRDLCNLLDVSADYIIGRAFTPQPMVATLESTPLWRNPAKGELPEEGEDMIVLWRSGKYPAVKLGVWKDGKFKDRDYGIIIPNVLAWQPYHYKEDDVPDSGTEGGNE